MIFFRSPPEFTTEPLFYFLVTHLCFVIFAEAWWLCDVFAEAWLPLRSAEPRGAKAESADR